MHHFGTLARLKRGEVNLILLVAFLAVLALPNGAYAASIPPQDCQAVLLFLQHDASLGLAGQGLSDSHEAFADSIGPGAAKSSVKSCAHFASCARFAALRAQSPCLTQGTCFGPDDIPSAVLLPAAPAPLGLLEWHEAISLSGIASGSSLE